MKDNPEQHVIKNYKTVAGTGFIDDLSKCYLISEDSIIKELKTYIGEILVGINPFCPLEIYGLKQHEEYSTAKQRLSLPPHIFWTASASYQRMLSENKRQCIVVSGESGAGKTECSKYMIEHIIHLCKNDVDKELQKKIIEINTLLEAFGNAKTCMNNNSSRFGKYLEMSFTNSGKILGARVFDYLLEKSRVVQHGPGERNYHIFYYLFCGMKTHELQSYFLESPEKYRILESKKTAKACPESLSKEEILHCEEMFEKQKSIMQRVGFTNEDIKLVFTILSAILHLTNIKFSQDEETDGVYIYDEQPLKIVSKLLELNQESLATALISTYSFTRNERVFSLKNIDQANDCRDALAKALYERLFSWIVHHINDLLEPPSFYKNQLDQFPSISILDMSGFENFPMNSFEQLCINVANEHLQFYFTEKIFLAEQEEFLNEQIDTKSIHFRNNIDLIDLFMGPLGMFALLDDESKFPKATDTSLVNKFHSQFKSSSRYIRPRGNDISFVINHYAGKVVYEARGFLEKNRDNLSSNIVECMKKSKVHRIAELFWIDKSNASKTPEQRAKSIEIRRQSETNKITNFEVVYSETMPISNTMSRDKWNQITVVSHFRNSLSELLNKLRVSDPLFIR